MAFGILNTFMARNKKFTGAGILGELGNRHIAMEMDENLEGSSHRVIKTEVPTVERPPIIDIPEYREKFTKANAP
jgi:glucosyl-3-phosphoglycerate synthase